MDSNLLHAKDIKISSAARIGVVSLTKLKAAGELDDSSGMRDMIDPSLTAAVGASSSERRRKDRINVRIPVRITSQGLAGVVSQDGTCVDISEAGVAFEANVDLFVGEIVDLEFQQKNEGLIHFQARLLNKAGNRYGGYFVSPGP